MCCSLYNVLLPWQNKLSWNHCSADWLPHLCISEEQHPGSLLLWCCLIRQTLRLGPFKPLKLNIWIPIILVLGHYLVKKFIWEIISETSKYLIWYLIWLKFEVNYLIWYLIWFYSKLKYLIRNLVCLKRIPLNSWRKIIYLFDPKVWK